MAGSPGLVNGADADARDIVLSLESMNAIERIDVPGRTLRAQAGAKLGQVQRAAEENGMVFPLDLGARDSATVGGNISTNAGGLRVLRYGMMRNLVLGIEAVLADGTVLTSLNRMLKNNAGLRPQAAVHRQRRHAGRRNARRVAPGVAHAQPGDHAGLAAEFRCPGRNC